MVKLMEDTLIRGLRELDEVSLVCPVVRTTFLAKQLAKGCIIAHHVK